MFGLVFHQTWQLTLLPLCWVLSVSDNETARVIEGRRVSLKSPSLTRVVEAVMSKETDDIWFSFPSNLATHFTTSFLGQAFFVQNQKTQFWFFKNSDPENLEKLSFCLKTQNFSETGFF